MPYDQDCHWGYRIESGIVVDEQHYNTTRKEQVFCKNPNCPYSRCLFSWYTNGEIPDSECPFYTKNVREHVNSGND